MVFWDVVFESQSQIAWSRSSAPLFPVQIMFILVTGKLMRRVRTNFENIAFDNSHSNANFSQLTHSILIHRKVRVDIALLESKFIAKWLK